MQQGSDNTDPPKNGRVFFKGTRRENFLEGNKDQLDSLSMGKSTPQVTYLRHGSHKLKKLAAQPKKRTGKGPNAIMVGWR